MKTNKAFWILLAVCALSILPFIGQTEFYTKGEPRESVVALTMLKTGNWILPENNGGDIPYKPPFFHWCIAAFSLITGSVNEYTSRLPSALAVIVMTMAGFCFFARRRGVQVAFIASAVLFTAFEIHRAGVNCRVDMVLTVAVVCAIYSLYRWWERGLKGFPLVAVLCMSVATLTKGPVGALLPCLVAGVFLLLHGYKFWRVFLYMFGLGICSMVLPLCWYVAAYQQGGESFLSLVCEENFGRFTGQMTYESHEEPLYYNFITLISGFAPWTLLILFSLFGLKYKKPDCTFKQFFNRMWTGFRGMDPCRQYSLLAAVLIFVFYCIPSSKRSVYIMPVYPFVAYFIAEYMLWLVKKHSLSVKIYGSVLSVVFILVFLVFVIVKLDFVPSSLISGKNAAENMALIRSLSDVNIFISLFALVPIVLSAMWMACERHMVTVRHLYLLIALTFGFYIAFDAVYQPAVLKPQSVKGLAAKVNEIVPEGNIYSFKEVDLKEYGNPLHFFGLNYYLNDRVRIFAKDKPAEGYIWMTVDDAYGIFADVFPDYELEEVFRADRRYDGAKAIQGLFKFKKVR